jgi:anti-anti-sigma factor
MQVQEREGCIVLSIVGDECAALWKAVEPYLATGKKSYVLDLAQVAYLNSVAVASIILVRNRIIAGGGKLALAHLTEPIRSVFSILKLERLFELDLDLERAIRLVK